MKAVRLENFGTKTPPGKSAEEWRRKKKNLTGTGWSSAPAESGESGGKDTGAAGTPPERRPTYSETMQGYYGDRYADALAENKTAADAAALEEGIASGATFLASVHCDAPESLTRKPQLARLLATGAFGAAVFLTGRSRPGTGVQWVEL